MKHWNEYHEPEIWETKMNDQEKIDRLEDSIVNWRSYNRTQCRRIKALEKDVKIMQSKLKYDEDLIFSLQTKLEAAEKTIEMYTKLFDATTGEEV
jgi:hypothetical protein